MKQVRRVASTVVLFCLSVAAYALAQETGHLNVRTVVQKQEVIVNDEGESVTSLVPANTVIPGESVVITTTFRNVGDEPAENVVITNPIDDSLKYVDGSAYAPGAKVQFSVDGGRTFGDRASLVVTEAGIERPADVEDFTHIRWVMNEELAVGAQGVARFTAVLE